MLLRTFHPASFEYSATGAQGFVRCTAPRASGD